MKTMRSIPDMITGLRALAEWEVLRDYHAALVNDAANYIEGATENLCQQAEQLIAMRVRLDEVRPLMEEAAKELADLFWEEFPDEEGQYKRDMILPNAIRSMLRWWEPGTTEPVSISHWGVIE